MGFLLFSDRWLPWWPWTDTVHPWRSVTWWLRHLMLHLYILTGGYPDDPGQIPFIPGGLSRGDCATFCHVVTAPPHVTFVYPDRWLPWWPWTDTVYPWRSVSWWLRHLLSRHNCATSCYICISWQVATLMTLDRYRLSLEVCLVVTVPPHVTFVHPDRWLPWWPWTDTVYPWRSISWWLCHLMLHLYILTGGYPDDPGQIPFIPGGLSRGDCATFPGLKHALCFAFRTDNSGPPLTPQV